MRPGRDSWFTVCVELNSLALWNRAVFSTDDDWRTATVPSGPRETAMAAQSRRLNVELRCLGDCRPQRLRISSRSEVAVKSENGGPEQMEINPKPVLTENAVGSENAEVTIIRVSRSLYHPFRQRFSPFRTNWPFSKRTRRVTGASTAPTDRCGCCYRDCGRFEAEACESFNPTRSSGPSRHRGQNGSGPALVKQVLKSLGSCGV